MHAITDHGQHDPIPYELGTFWQTVADEAREEIRRVRIERNEREIERLMGNQQRGDL